MAKQVLIQNLSGHPVNILYILNREKLVLLHWKRKIIELNIHQKLPWKNSFVFVPAWKAQVKEEFLFFLNVFRILISSPTEGKMLLIMTQKSSVNV